MRQHHVGTVVLATWPANAPPAVSTAWIGDYQQLITIGNTFYGTFSASNNPLVADFPSGVYFQRDVRVGGVVESNFYLQADGVLDDGTGHMTGPAVSIDPFFFTVAAG
jgi:hypothetical protein